MDDTTDERETQEISLLESLNGEWIKMPLAAMQDVGPAVQTLGGLLKVTNRETYSPVSDIAGKARVPIATARKHLVILDGKGWINNRGREHTRRGAPRRTATIAISKHTKNKIEPYGVLPWWACCSIRKVGKLPWSVKAVLSIIMARLAALRAGAQQQADHQDDEELIGAIDNMGGEDRFRFSLTWLMRQTGLTHDSITTAKRLLKDRFGLVQWIGTPRPKGKFRPGATPETDLLVPNWDFRGLVTPASPEHCYLDFRGYAKTGQ